MVNVRRMIGCFVLLVSALAAGAQKLRKDDRQLLEGLQQHVARLAHDSLEGRRTGTPGEAKAAAYISGQFAALGLAPKGTQGYLQPFTIAEGKAVNPSTHLLINGHNLELDKDYFPLVFSANGSLEALPSMGLREADMPWFVDLKELLLANAANPHFDLHEWLRQEAATYKSKGASALFLYNTSGKSDGLQFQGRDGGAVAPIPIVYLQPAAARRFLSDEEAVLDLKLRVDIAPRQRTGHNVAGFIDNGAPLTVVVGAHYDHLGYGEDNNSMSRDGRAIHNGADDNASGTAAMLELARLLKASKAKTQNYLFIAFSGEELGLFGSKYFVENPTVPLNTVSYMINMDMVGRLNESTRMVTVGGFGTSPVWGEAFAATGRNKLYTGPIAFRFDSSGTGPSDHTSFYRKDIPVLFYFTGLHTDYHRPGDDADKLNYEGALHLVKHVESLIGHTAKSGKPAFVRTREAQMATSARFSVSLGIMPDYTFSGGGVRVDGVSSGRAAEKAGIRTGDVITSLGARKVTSVETYMQALADYKKGDQAKVTWQRGGQELSATIEF